MKKNPTSSTSIPVHTQPTDVGVAGYLQGLCSAACNTFDPSTRIEDGSWVLDYFYDDGLRVRTGREDAGWEPRPAWTAWLYPPGLPRWQQLQRGCKSVRGAWTVFLPTSSSLVQELIPTGSPFARFDDPDHILGRLLDELNALLLTFPGRQPVYRDLPILDLILDVLLHAEAGTTTRRITKLPPRLSARLLAIKVDFLLRHCYAQPIGRGDMARRVGLTETHLSRRYLEHTGRTPMQALMNIRIHAAARMLEHGLSLKEIAAQTGFCDPSHMCRVFKSILGITPGEFLRKLDRSDAEALTTLPGTWDYHRSSTVLSGTVRLSREALDSRQRLLNSQVWVLDAFLTPGVRRRATGEREPWVEESPGWLRLYSPDCPYWEDGRAAQKPIVSLSLTFVALPSSCIAIKYGAGPRCIRFHDPNQRIITRMQQLAVLQECPGPGSLRDSLCIFQKLIIQLTRAQPIDPGAFRVVDNPSDHPLVARVVSLLETRYHEPLLREQIAAHVGVSVSTLSHVYAKETGEGPMKTLQKIRIRHARVLLARGIPVAAVARQVGFEDASSFSRIFRQSDHMPPSQYQQLSFLSTEDTELKNDVRGAI